MKRICLLCCFILAIILTPVAKATYEQAYKDYLYQFDIYRQNYTNFQVAKNEYQKFNTLTSQTTALEATKKMLTQRDVLLKSYLFALNEKLNASGGHLSDSDRQLYQTLIRNEVGFLDTHANFIPSIGSLSDAEDVSEQLESHYIVLHTSIRQALNVLAIGEITGEASKYDAILTTAQTMVDDKTSSYSQEKLSTLNRWIQQIKNKKVLYDQKIETAKSFNSALSGNSIQELDQAHTKIQSTIADAKQYLFEGIGFEKELLLEMKYLD